MLASLVNSMTKPYEREAVPQAEVKVSLCFGCLLDPHCGSGSVMMWHNPQPLSPNRGQKHGSKTFPKIPKGHTVPHQCFCQGLSTMLGSFPIISSNPRKISVRQVPLSLPYKWEMKTMSSKITELINILMQFRLTVPAHLPNQLAPCLENTLPRCCLFIRRWQTSIHGQEKSSRERKRTGIHFPASLAVAQMSFHVLVLRQASETLRRKTWMALKKCSKFNKSRD